MKHFATAGPLILFVWLATQAAQGQIVFSNLASGDSYLPVGVSIGETPSPAFVYAGVSFTPQNQNYVLSKIEMPLRLLSGPNQLNVWLMSDLNGLPNGIIEAYQLSNQMQSAFTLIPISSTKRPVLAAGTRYWLVATGGSSSTFAMWAQNSLNQTGPNVSGSGLTSLVADSTNNLVPAFRVSANSITGISPTSTEAGGPQFTLTVNGSNFPAGSSVTWNGSPLATTSTSPTQLAALVPSALIASSGSATVAVGSAGSATFTITPAPTPGLSSANPAGAVAGGAQFTLGLTGANFLSWAQIRWNGQGLATTYLNASQLSASVPANLIANAGPVALTVANAADAVSNALTFTVTCGYTLSNSTSAAGAAPQLITPATGGTGAVNVTTAQGCPWTAASSVSWVTITLGATGSGGGQVTFSVAANGGPARSTNLIIAGQSFLISQLGAQPAISSQGVINAASPTAGIASGAWIAIFGSNLSTTTRPWGTSDFAGNKLPVLIDGVSVSINGLPAYVYYVSPTQLDVLAPQDPATGPVTLQVTNALGSASASVNKQPVAPAFFALAGSNPRYAIASLPDGSYAGKPQLYPGSNARPAKPGDVVALYLTGLGATNPAYPDGQIVQQPEPLAATVSVTVGGMPAQVNFAGLVEAGVYQVNVQIPSVADGDAAITLQVQGFSFSDQAYLPIQQ